MTFARFAGYADEPFSEFRALLQVVPLYVNDAVDHQLKVLAAKVFPDARRLASLHGAFWQWYDVARLYHLLGDSRQAAVTVQKAIDLQPDYQPAWQRQHRLNAEEVARKTGRPIEYFYPKLDDSIEKLMQEMLMTPEIELRNLTKRYKAGLFKKPVQALKGVDLTVRQGEVFGLIGPTVPARAPPSARSSA